MDYEQDYSKLTSFDNHWYLRRPVGSASSEEETATSVIISLDNEDFD